MAIFGNSTRRCFHIVGKAFAALLLSGLFAAAQATPFQQYKQQFDCPNQSLCELDFPVVPPQRAVTITDVSCKIRIGSQAVEILYTDFVVLNASNQTTVTDTSIPVLLGKNGLGSWFSLHNQTELTYGPGSHVRVSVATDTISEMTLQCKIAGDVRVN